MIIATNDKATLGVSFQIEKNIVNYVVKFHDGTVKQFGADFKAAVEEFNAVNN